VSSLGQFDSSEDAVSLLIPALSDTDVWVAGYAAEALCNSGPMAAPAIPSLIVALGHEAHNVRFASVQTLTAIGETAIPALIAALGDAVMERRAGAVEALGNAVPPTIQAFPFLCQALQDPEERVRFLAAIALGKVGRDHPETVGTLLRAFSDDSFRMQYAVLSALATLGSSAVQAVPFLIEKLVHATNHICADVVRALGAIGPGAHAAIPALTEALRDVSMACRCAAVQALGQMGTAAAHTIPVLIALYESQEQYENNLLSGWTQVGERFVPVPEVAREGAEAARNQSCALRLSIVRVLGQWGIRSDAAVPLLERALTDHDTDIREAAAIALGEIGPAAARAAPTLEALLAVGDVNTVWDRQISDEIVRSALQAIQGAVEHSS
jgi:HEAT repeat protein